MQIPVVTVLTDGAKPPASVMNRLRDRGSLAGYSGPAGCPSCPGLGIVQMDYGASIGSNTGGGGWGETFQTIAEDWSRIGGQLLLNKNPAPIYQQTAAGTTVYAQTGAPVSPASTSGWVVPALLVGGVVLVMVMMRR